VRVVDYLDHARSRLKRGRPRSICGARWRQHVASTMVLVDTVAEQAVLERLIEASKHRCRAKSPHSNCTGCCSRVSLCATAEARVSAAERSGVFYGAEQVALLRRGGLLRWRHCGIRREFRPCTASADRVQGAGVVPRSTCAIRRSIATATVDASVRLRRLPGHRRVARKRLAVGSYESVRDSRHGAVARA